MSRTYSSPTASENSSGKWVPWGSNAWASAARDLAVGGTLGCLAVRADIAENARCVAAGLGEFVMAFAGEVARDKVLVKVASVLTNLAQPGHRPMHTTASPGAT
jgi:hypothetical protein